MKKQPEMRRAAFAVTLAAVMTPFVAAPRAHAQAACNPHVNLLRLSNPLAHIARKLTNREPIVIVAIGSSSTAGVGASSKMKNYPSRLEIELKRRFPGRPIKVLNRGIGGEVIADMLRRFDKAVMAAKPDLVLWQLGTNSLLRHRQPADPGAAIRAGLAKIRAAGADVVLIDPQFAPKVIAKPGVAAMLRLIALTAKEENVDLFRRFAVMKRWHDNDHMDFPVFVSRDGLHMNDWSYGCMAKGLAAAIADAATRPLISATAAPQLAAP